jgi:DNA-binding MurR/RpiR family transcriptional regulator
MSEYNVLDRMTSLYNKLTKAEKKVADYVFANQVETQYLSITDLALLNRVAEATIFRFCKTLGFAGYNDFKLSLAKSTVPNSQRDDAYDIYGKVKPDDSIGDMCKKLYNSSMDAVAQTLQKIDESAIMQAVDIIAASARVFCFGQGGSSILAMEAWGRFLTVTSHFYHVQDNHLQAMASALLGSGDSILFFSYSGSTRDMMDILPDARKRGVKVVLVTHFPHCAAASYADVVLLCGSNEGPLQMGSVAAKMAQLFLVDVLFNEFCRRQLDKTIVDREATAKAITAKMM